MKHLSLIYFGLLVLVLSACQPSNKEAIVSGNNSCITDPVSCGGKGTQAVQGQAYQNNQGYYPYGYGMNYGSGYGYGYNQPFNYYNNTAYLCNCPMGTVPTYNAGNGIGCVSQGYLNSGYGLSAYFYLGWGSNQWNSLPQMYKYNYGGGSNYCYNGAVQSCTVGQANNCPSGSMCRPNNNNSSLGLCVASYR